MMWRAVAGLLWMGSLLPWLWGRGWSGDWGLTESSSTGDSHNCQTPVSGLGLGVDFTCTWDNYNNDNDNYKNNPHLNFLKGTVLGDKERGLGLRDKRDKGQGKIAKWSLTLKTKSRFSFSVHGVLSGLKVF